MYTYYALFSVSLANAHRGMSKRKVLTIVVVYSRLVLHEKARSANTRVSAHWINKDILNHNRRLVEYNDSPFGPEGATREREPDTQKR
jgi:hypothetical protein